MAYKYILNFIFILAICFDSEKIPAQTRNIQESKIEFIEQSYSYENNNSLMKYITKEQVANFISSVMLLVIDGFSFELNHINIKIPSTLDRKKELLKKYSNCIEEILESDDFKKERYTDNIISQGIIKVVGKVFGTKLINDVWNETRTIFLIASLQGYDIYDKSVQAKVLNVLFKTETTRFPVLIIKKLILENLEIPFADQVSDWTNPYIPDIVKDVILKFYNYFYKEVKKVVVEYFPVESFITYFTRNSATTIDLSIEEFPFIKKSFWNYFVELFR